jgi:hypothetical protein
MSINISVPTLKIKTTQLYIYAVDFDRVLEIDKTFIDLIFDCNTADEIREDYYSEQMLELIEDFGPESTKLKVMEMVEKGYLELVNEED